MKTIIAILTLLSLTACSTVNSIVGKIPSFNDTNQSAKIIDVRQDIARLDCGRPLLPQAQQIQRDLEWFHLYSESAGLRHQDVLRLIAPMEETTNELAERAAKAEPSAVYCKLKKDILTDQASSAAKAILGRF